MMKMLKKWLKRGAWLVIYIIVALNLFIILSGRFYLYKGIYYTYLQGETGPTIYDIDKFEKTTLKASKDKKPWTFASKKGTMNLSDTKYVEKWESTSFLILKNDQIAYEKYWGEHHPKQVSNSFSAAKTVISVLIGIALDEGKIKSLDDKVCKYLPKFSGAGKEKITIRHLLTMSSGLNWQESGKNPISENAESYFGSDLWGLIHKQRVERKPGEFFNYQSGNSQMLGFIIKKATGKSVSQYAAEKLWQPLQSENDAFWSLDKKGGFEKSFCCLYATTRDFARIGSLFNHQGKWGDKQILSVKYFQEMTTPYTLKTKENVPNTRYGLHVWTYNYNGKKVVYCRGIKGQYIICIPDEQLVIVRTGHKRAPNVLEKQGIMSKAYKEKLDHPEDLFEYIDIARRTIQ
jgi:CubicO group peptidase (beta-lactamase class C family)